MRIDQPFETTGEFWLPHKPEHCTGGTLTIDEHGTASLHLVDRISRDHAFEFQHLNTNLGERVPTTTIFGRTAKHRFVTLQHCFYKPGNITLFAMSPSAYSVGRVIFRTTVEPDEPLTVNELQFTVDGLIQWLDRTGFTFANEKQQNTFNVTYTLPSDITVGNYEDVTIKFFFNAKPPNWTIKQEETSITQNATISLRSDQGRSIDDFIYIARQFNDFLSLGLGSTVLMTSMTVYSAELDDSYDQKPDRFPIPIYFDDGRRNNPSFKPAVFMPFSFDHVEKDLEEYIQTWFSTYNLHEQAIQEFFLSTTNSKLSITSRFLSMVQIIETIYEQTPDEKREAKTLLKLRRDKVDLAFPEDDELRLMLWNGLGHWSGPSLRQLMDRVFHKVLVFEEYDFDKAIGVVVSARNALSHKAGESFKDEHEARDVILSTLALENVIRIWLLQMMGFDETKLSETINRSHIMKSRLDILRDFAERE